MYLVMVVVMMVMALLMLMAFYWLQRDLSSGWSRHKSQLLLLSNFFGQLRIKLLLRYCLFLMGLHPASSFKSNSLL